MDRLGGAGAARIAGGVVGVVALRPCMKLPRPLGMLVRMDRWMRYAPALGITLVLAACGATRRTVVVEPSAGTAVRPVVAAQPGARSGKTYRVVHGEDRKSTRL